MHFRIKRGIYLVVSVLIIGIILGYFFWLNHNVSKVGLTAAVQPTPQVIQNSLTIKLMREESYPGSDLTIEKTLPPGTIYKSYIASYKSQGLKIYGLLTIPEGSSPVGGWPAIIFNHGYIQPDQYRTTERYIAYVDTFASHGFVVFKPDYRGNGSSEGQPGSSYYSPGYTIDVLNALASLKRNSQVNSQKIGMWGHSMGGNITLRSLVVSPDIKAAVIWGGVVGTYDDLMNNWANRVPFHPPPTDLALRNKSRVDLVAEYGTPQQNSSFWQSIDPNYNLQYVTAPVQLDVGLSDEEVPWQFSQGLEQRLSKLGKTVEFYTYSGADHNISGQAFNQAMQHSLDFFNKYLKS